MKRIFLERAEWWHLVPDQTLFAGGNVSGEILNLSARHRDGRWAMVYLGSQASFSIHMDKLAGGQVQASWIDPRTGETQTIGRFATNGVQSFATSDAWEDALLILET